MRQRRTVLVLAVVLAAVSMVVGSPAAPAGASDPTGAVAGRVTSDAGQGVAGVRVLVYDGNSPAQQLAHTMTAADGRYSLRGVPAGSGYAVCFDVTAATSAPVEGYLGNCGTRRPWTPGSIPFGYEPVHVEEGQTARLDSTLDHAGGITGEVTTHDGAPLGGVVVQVTDLLDSITRVTTAADGTYHIRNVDPGNSPYRRVCFDPSAATGATSAGGWLAQCWSGRYWRGPDPQASKPGDPVPVVVDAATPGVDAHLDPGATVTGTVRADADGAPLKGLLVEVWSTSLAGIYQPVQFTTTAADGSYRLRNLPGAADYALCVLAWSADGNPSHALLQSECWRDRPWDTRRDDRVFAADSTRITLTPGTLRRFDFGLAATGHVAGTVTNAAAAPLADVLVGVYRGTTEIGRAKTDSAGHYDVPGLPPTTTGYSVCLLPSALTNATRPGGYRAECANDRYVPLPFAVPDGVTPVPVPPGATATVDAQLTVGTAFTGRLTAAVSGAQLIGMPVLLLDPSGRELARHASGQDGSYRFTGLDPRVSYRICALGPEGTQSTTADRFASRCNGNVVWSGALAAPTGTPLPGVAGGSTRVDLALTRGGEIIGSARPGPRRFDLVVVDADGHRVGTGLTVQASHGGLSYDLQGVTPETGPYRVCFANAADPGAPSSTTRYGFAPMCWNGAGNATTAWDGALADLPAVATVTVTAGSTTTGVDAGAFAAAGAISGVVRVGSEVSVGTVVTVFAPSGAAVGSATTGPHGYTVPGLNPATGPYRVCAVAPNGFGSRCWMGAPWSGTGPPPAGAAGRTVTGNQVTTGTDIRLARV